LDTEITQTKIDIKPSIDVPCFDFNTKVVWGATGMVLNELRHLLLY
jgi:hypothetical protein